jgi:hypothetical protein
LSSQIRHANLGPDKTLSASVRIETLTKHRLFRRANGRLEIGRLARLERAVHLQQGAVRIRIGAQRAGDQHRVKAGVRQRNLVSRKPDQITRQPRLGNARVRQRMHLQCWAKPGDVDDSLLVVMANVQAGADADFQHTPLCPLAPPAGACG